MFITYCLQNAEPVDIKPPDDVHISDIHPNQFTIEWNPSASNCPVAIATYYIATTNCGLCSNTTSNTYIVCTNLRPMLDGQVCLVAIQATVCENSSKPSEAANLTIVLKGN